MARGGPSAPCHDPIPRMTLNSNHHTARRASNGYPDHLDKESIQEGDGGLETDAFRVEAFEY